MTSPTRTLAGPLCAAVAGLVFAGAGAQEAQRPLPTTAGSRISDEAIKGDLEAFAALQDRIRLLNDRVATANYHLAKAQAYLDLAFDEYHENDRSGVVEATMTEAVALVQALESKAPQLPMTTGPLRDEKPLRPDLWAQAEALKQQAGFACAGQTVAKLEIALLHAGHEAGQGGWRRARPHVEMAEDFAADAQAAAAACPPQRR